MDDRVRLAPSLDVGRKRADRRIVRVRRGLLRVEVADVAGRAVRVLVCRLPPSVALVPRHAPELGRRRRQVARRVRRDDGRAFARPAAPPFWPAQTYSKIESSVATLANECSPRGDSAGQSDAREPRKRRYRAARANAAYTPSNKLKIIVSVLYGDLRLFQG